MRLKKHDDYCKDLADELEAVANNNVAFCPDCNAYIRLDGVDDVVTDPDTGDDVAHCPECGKFHDIDELEEFVTMHDYFSDFLDANFTIDWGMSYRGVRVQMTYGGPNVYINTNTHSVQLYWWSESGEYPLSGVTVEEINMYFEELYEMKR